MIIDFDRLYYIFCIKMGRSEDEFFTSSLNKILYLIDTWAEEKRQFAEALNGNKGSVSPNLNAQVKKFSDIRGLI